MSDLSITLQDYQIVISENLDGLAEYLAQADRTQYFAIADENTDLHCWPALQAACKDLPIEKIVVPAGEEHKNLDTCQLIWKKLLDLRADRQALVINLGGGVVGDMGGFAASCYKRGIDFVHVPTTVLSQVDSSLGGKLGVDFRYGKNLIGLFNNPKLVHISTVFHRSLSDRQYMNGFAEIFKHAIIGSRSQWDIYSKAESLRSLDQVKLLRDALMVKKEIVEIDPFEKAQRKALNFGHTLGHAVEAWSIEHTADPLLHGEAIAIGMIMETYLSQSKAGLQTNTAQEIIEVLAAHYPYRELPLDISDLLWEYMKYDKKNIRDRVMAALIREIEEPVWNIEILREDMDRAVCIL